MINIPADFARFIRTVFLEDGEQWLAHLPRELDHITQTWELELGDPFANLSYNLVLPATHSDGQPAVLKIGVPRPELKREIAAMHLYNGRGAAKLLAAEPERGILLLERLTPGTLLHQAAADGTATRIAADLMQKLWRPAPPTHPHPFRPLTQWAQAITQIGATHPLPTLLVDKAQHLLTDLLASADGSVLLHGDFHHENILLASQQQWKAIDPKGIIGDPYYEPAPFLYNPIGILNHADGRQRLNRRLDIFAETLQFDRQRLAAYGFCQCLLSAAWSIEDNTDWHYAIHCATLFD